jgi:hypothetical protein
VFWEELAAVLSFSGGLEEKWKQKVKDVVAFAKSDIGHVRTLRQNPRKIKLALLRLAITGSY